jgi:lysophospholipase L1-like esterase
MVGKSRQTCKEGYNWLKSNLKSKTKKLGSIWIYVWLGASDLTSKTKKYIALTAEDDQAVNIAYEYLLEILALVKDYPSCIITIQEIPVYSIKDWNQRKVTKTWTNL